ncbi:MAG: transcription initiation factor IIB [Promethearchaeota archaeon]
MVIVQENYNSYNACSECNGPLISIIERGETVCSQCGLVIHERELDLSHDERRTFNRDDQIKKSRTGPPISSLLPDIGLCTIIDNRYIYNANLKRAVKRDTHMSWETRNMLIATTELKRLCSNLNLPDYIKIAALKLYKKAFKTNLLKGRSIIGMVVACIYVTCKEKHVPRTFQEILNETHLSPHTIKKCCKVLVNSLNLKVITTNPIDLVPKFITGLGLNFEIEKLTVKILQDFLTRFSISGKNPLGICAGAIYLALKLNNIKVSQKDIAKIVGVTEVTLRSRYKELIDKKIYMIKLKN